MKQTNSVYQTHNQQENQYYIQKFKRGEIWRKINEKCNYEWIYENFEERFHFCEEDNVMHYIKH